MGMMGYSNEGGGGEMSTADPFGGGRLRPLMPRYPPSSSLSFSSSTSSSASSSMVGHPPDLHGFSRFHGTDFFSLNHHLEQSKREFNPQQVIVSSRWNPTPEQLQTLEELYRRGTRTPSAEQIQHITAQLRRYGKIEGKNVFYWFQNHKARERQKRRRRLESGPDPHVSPEIEVTEKRDLGVNGTGYEVEQTKTWAPPTNFSTLSEKTSSFQTLTRAAEVSEIRRGVEPQNHQSSWLERNATWQQAMHFTASSLPANLPNPTPATTSSPTEPPTLNRMHPRGFSMLTQPYKLDPILRNSGRDDGRSLREESQTLQLFPLGNPEDGGEDENTIAKEVETRFPVSGSNHAGPTQFFEFLPVKN